MDKLVWRFEPYDPMIVANRNKVHYTVMSLSNCGSIMTAIVSGIDMKGIRFTGTLYECLEFCEKVEAQ